MIDSTFGFVRNHPILVGIVVLVLLIVGIQYFTGAPGNLAQTLVKQFVSDQTAKLQELQQKQDDTDKLLVQKDEFYIKKEQDLLKKIQDTQRQVVAKDAKIREYEVALGTEQRRRSDLELALEREKLTTRTIGEIHARLRDLGHSSVPAPVVPAAIPR